MFNAENDAGLVYIERSKTDHADEGAKVAITTNALAVLKLL